VAIALLLLFLFSFGFRTQAAVLQLGLLVANVAMVPYLSSTRLLNYAHPVGTAQYSAEVVVETSR
jgi:hypothetical protein